MFYINVFAIYSGLTNIMATNSDYGTTKNVWQGWRDASGKKMKKDFQEMIRILNKAAKKNGYFL